jgi:hypothetical protein
MPDWEYFDLYGEWPVYSRRGLLQYRFPEYSSRAYRMARFHRKRPYRAL